MLLDIKYLSIILDFNIHMKSIECAKFRGSGAIVVLCGFNAIVPSYLCGYFVGLKFFLVNISQVQTFFSWVFRGSEIFSCGYFVGTKFSLWVFVGPKFLRRYTWSELFLVGISWVQLFFLVIDFMIQRFSVAGCINKSDKNRNAKMYLNPRTLF